MYIQNNLLYVDYGKQNAEVVIEGDDAVEE